MMSRNSKPAKPSRSPKPPVKRPQPIRDAILAFLTEPRSARSIAAHIQRTVPIATGHLAAMRRKGLVLRLGFAAYARRLRRIACGISQSAHYHAKIWAAPFAKCALTLTA